MIHRRAMIIMRCAGVLAVLIWMPLILSACSGAGKEAKPSFDDLAQLNSQGVTIGAVEGTNPANRLPSLFPDAKYKYFRSEADGILAMQQGQVDGFISATPTLQYAIARLNVPMKLLTAYADSESAFAISRKGGIPGLKGQINRFLSQAKDSGLLDEMYQRWVMDADTRMPDIPEAENPIATLHVGVSGMMEPFEFYANNEISGFGAEFVRRFALEMGYRIEFRMSNLTALLADCQTGVIDMICGSLSHTAEREEMFDFSDTVFVTGASVAVLDTESAGAGNGGLWNYLVDSFEKTFIREQRWKMILSGLGVTILISALSILGGSLLGFVLCLAKRSPYRALSGVVKGLIQLIQGMPIVLLLMICFYLIFSGVGLGEIIVAVIAFSVYLAVYVADILDTGMSGVSKNEIEGATALGFNRVQIFRKIVFPQAVAQVFPVYQGHVVNLIKQTSVVGYIAVMDLTKASDLIRSRTFDAFFPLITTAIIYFLIARICIFLMKKAHQKLTSRRRRGGNQEAA